MGATAAGPSLLIWGRRGKGGRVRVSPDQCEAGRDKTAPKTQELLDVLGDVLLVGTRANPSGAISGQRALLGPFVLSEGDVDRSMSIFLTGINTPRGQGPQKLGPRKAAEASAARKRNPSGGRGPGGLRAWTGRPDPGGLRPGCWGPPLVSPPGCCRESPHLGHCGPGSRAEHAHETSRALVTSWSWSLCVFSWLLGRPAPHVGRLIPGSLSVFQRRKTHLRDSILEF